MLEIRFAKKTDVPQILTFIKALAAYEKLSHEVVATVDHLEQTLFGQVPAAEVLIAETEGVAQGFALFFHSYSTFLAKPGIYLEDLFVLPEARGKGLGKALLKKLAQLTLERSCGRLEWAVLGWNKAAIDLYLALGAKPQSEWTTHRMTGENLLKLAQS